MYIELINIDTARPYPKSLGGSRYITMFLDSAFRLQRPYDSRDKSAPVIGAVVKRFMVDMEVPRAFRTDNGSQCTYWIFAEYCDVGIHGEFTAPYAPQQNGLVEIALARTNKTGLAARLEVKKLFPDVHLERGKGVWDRVRTRL